MKFRYWKDGRQHFFQTPFTRIVITGDEVCILKHYLIRNVWFEKQRIKLGDSG
jgi:hypothetical protein